MPLDTAGKDTEDQPRSWAQAKADARARNSFASSSPSPWRGPTAWITPLKGSLPAVVTTAVPVGKRTLLFNQEIGFPLQRGPRGARNDARHPAAVREVPVRGVDDGVDRLVEQVAPHDEP